jgi:Holliday junction resolvase-like predicted endonuclease
MSNPINPFTSHHVGVAAEAIAAALFARCGLDVSVQYGANQPEYDLIVARDQKMLKVSVKGSKDGAWGLTQSWLERGKADYHGAIDGWLAQHKKKTVMCFVQFDNVQLNEMPRCYLASPGEVAERLRATSNGRGAAILWEKKVWTARASAAGTVDAIPAAWNFSVVRVEELFRREG